MNQADLITYTESTVKEYVDSIFYAKKKKEAARLKVIHFMISDDNADFFSEKIREDVITSLDENETAYYGNLIEELTHSEFCEKYGSLNKGLYTDLIFIIKIYRQAEDLYNTEKTNFNKLLMIAIDKFSKDELIRSLT